MPRERFCDTSRYVIFKRTFVCVDDAAVRDDRKLFHMTPRVVLERLCVPGVVARRFSGYYFDPDWVPSPSSSEGTSTTTVSPARTSSMSTYVYVISPDTTTTVPSWTSSSSSASRSPPSSSVFSCDCDACHPPLRLPTSLPSTPSSSSVEPYRFPTSLPSMPSSSSEEEKKPVAGPSGLGSRSQSPSLESKFWAFINSSESD